MTKHYKVTPLTELKVGDFVIVKGKWAEIYGFHDDYGTHTSQGWVCRTELYKKRFNSAQVGDQKFPTQLSLGN